MITPFWHYLGQPQKYYWPGDSLTDIPPQDLTEVTPDAIRRFLARASRIMGVYGPLRGVYYSMILSFRTGPMMPALRLSLSL